MDLQLRDHRVLVTGASRGIGLEIARAFVAEGARVVATARQRTSELDEAGVDFIGSDLSTPDGPRRLVAEVLERDPRLDVVVNNAGGGTLTTDIFDDPIGGDDDTWARMLDLNLLAAVRVTRAALPALLASSGAIVNVSSDGARRPGSPPSYAAAKAGLNAFTRGLAETLAPQGVRVNTVSPSSTLTPLVTGDDGAATLLSHALGTDKEEVLAQFPQLNGMLTAELIDPSEIARAVLLLASPTMPSAVGQNWAVDAGAVKVA